MFMLYMMALNQKQQLHTITDGDLDPHGKWFIDGI